MNNEEYVTRSSVALRLLEDGDADSALVHAVLALAATQQPEEKKPPVTVVHRVPQRGEPWNVPPGDGGFAPVGTSVWDGSGTWVKAGSAVWRSESGKPYAELPSGRYYIIHWGERDE